MSTKMMTEAERRKVLEGIARDEQAYPRDRISAIKVLEQLAKQEEPLGVNDELDAELDRIIERHRVDD